MADRDEAPAAGGGPGAFKCMQCAHLSGPARTSPKVLPADRDRNPFVTIARLILYRHLPTMHSLQLFGVGPAQRDSHQDL